MKGKRRVTPSRPSGAGRACLRRRDIKAQSSTRSGPGTTEGGVWAPRPPPPPPPPPWLCLDPDGPQQHDHRGTLPRANAAHGPEACRPRCDGPCRALGRARLSGGLNSSRSPVLPVTEAPGALGVPAGGCWAELLCVLRSRRAGPPSLPTPRPVPGLCQLLLGPPVGLGSGPWLLGPPTTRDAWAPAGRAGASTHLCGARRRRGDLMLNRRPPRLAAETRPVSLRVGCRQGPQTRGRGRAACPAWWGVPFSRGAPSADAADPSWMWCPPHKETVSVEGPELWGQSCGDPGEGPCEGHP